MALRELFAQVSLQLRQRAGPGQLAVQRASAGEGEPHRVAVQLRSAARLHAFQRAGQQPVQGADAGQRHLQLVPAHAIHRDEAPPHAAVLHLHQHAAARAGFIRVPALRVARVHRHAAAREQVLGARVDVAQRPVVQSARAQARRGAGRVVGVALRAAQVGVQQPHAEAVPGAAEARGEVVAHLHVWIGDALHAAQAPAFALHLHLFPVRAKHLHRGGQPQRAGVSAQRVMVAVDDEGGDARRVQPSQLAPQRQPRAHRAVLHVEEVTGEQQEGHPLPQADLRDARERAERRILEAPQERPLGGDAPERRVQVQVGGMNELEGHGAVSTVPDAARGPDIPARSPGRWRTATRPWVPG